MPIRQRKKNSGKLSLLTKIRRQYREMVHEEFSEPLLMALMLALGLIMLLLAIKT